MWRPRVPGDDDLLVEMCRELYREDPGPQTGGPCQMRHALEVLHREPWRGCAVVLESEKRVVGYALLIAYWSNEFGGEVCAVDELFVARNLRGRGHGAALFDAIERGHLWHRPIVAIALGVNPGNSRARRLYDRLGFVAVGLSMVKRLSPRPSA
jgi:GNAT superfamily N-acetyltransferase